MKKALSIILSLCIAIAILFSAVSCGRTEDEVKDEPGIVYEDGENGNKTMEPYYGADGKLEFYIVCEYDENWNKTKESRYDADGKLVSYNVYEYDENGKFIKQSRYDADGRLMYSN